METVAGVRAHSEVNPLANQTQLPSASLTALASTSTNQPSNPKDKIADLEALAIVSSWVNQTQLQSSVSLSAFNSWIRTASSQYWTGIASSSDGTKLAAVALAGYIFTSVDSGVTWTQTASIQGWITRIASSSDGAKLAAVVF